MTRILVSAEGQTDNVGDSVLRRGLLDALRPHGRLVVRLAETTDEYVTGLRLHPEDTVVSSRAQWQQEVLAAARRGDVLAHNAGEALLTRGWALGYARMAPLLALARLRGGHAVHLGFGLRAPHPVWGPVVHAALAPCDLVTWRDDDSRRWAGTGSTAPDWGWAAGPTGPGGTHPGTAVADLPTSGRDVLALSMRGDRAVPSDAWFATVRAVAADRGLTVVVAPQVGRDRARAAELAARLDGELVDADDWAHDAVESRVRAVYRRAALVVSDRLHAVVVGHTEGAVPVGLGQGVAKIGRTLATVGLARAAVPADDAAVAVPAVHALLDDRDAVLTAADDARDRLVALAERVGRLVHGGRRTDGTSAVASGAATDGR